MECDHNAINVGGDNTAIVTSALVPTVGVVGGQPNIDIGNNSVVNVGKNNYGVVQGGFSNGVYQVGNRNIGAAGGVLSNLIQIGNDNYSLTKSMPSSPTAKVVVTPSPNTAGGLGATNVVIGNRNSANAIGNLVVATTVGNDNKNTVKGQPGSGLLGQLAPNLSISNVFGNGNKVSSIGNLNVTNVVGSDNRVRVRGNATITTVLGSLNRVRSHGSFNLNSLLGNKSKMRTSGDGNVNASVGDDKTSIKDSE